MDLGAGNLISADSHVTEPPEPIGMKMVAGGLLPADNVMWCDDYPHGASTWPESRNVIAETMKDLNESDRRKIVRDNAARLYGIA